MAISLSAYQYVDVSTGLFRTSQSPRLSCAEVPPSRCLVCAQAQEPTDTEEVEERRVLVWYTVAPIHTAHSYTTQPLPDTLLYNVQSSTSNMCLHCHRLIHTRWDICCTQIKLSNLPFFDTSGKQCAQQGALFSRHEYLVEFHISDWKDIFFNVLVRDWVKIRRLDTSIYDSWKLDRRR